MIRWTYWMMLLAMLTLFAGCGEKPQEPAEKAPGLPAVRSDAEEEGHSHGEGPHGGTVADWGAGDYHVEFLANHDTQEATVHILGSDAKSPTPVKAESLLLTIGDPFFQVELLPSPLDGETDGASSRFVGKHEKLGIEREFAGTISGVVEGTPYAGDFKEEPHDSEEASHPTM